MSKLLNGIHTLHIERDPDVTNWNAAVRRKLGPFVRRKSILSRYREILRTELMNLRKVERNPECMKLLLRLVRLYRKELTVDPAHSLQQLIVLFPGTGTADENWMSLFMRAEQPPSQSIQDLVHSQFDWMDVVLDGCHKYHFRTLYSFALHRDGGRFPSGVTAKDYGVLIGDLPQSVRSEFRFLCEDPEHGIAVNQWRNIAAHKSFVLRSSRTLDVTYGRDPNQVTLSMLFSKLWPGTCAEMRHVTIPRNAGKIVQQYPWFVSRSSRAFRASDGSRMRKIHLLKAAPVFQAEPEKPGWE